MFSGRQFITVLFSGRQCIKVVFSGRQWICGLRQPSWRRTQSRCRTTGPASPSVDQSENIRFLISNYLSIYLNRTLHACFSIHLWILIYLSINLDCFLLKQMTSFAVRPSVATEFTAIILGTWEGMVVLFSTISSFLQIQRDAHVREDTQNK